MEYWSGVAVALFGLIFGSFLNVCISRFPKEESIIFPASHCPKCKHAIRWHDNIPLFSYIALGGKCRDCKERISVRYPVVEALNAFFWVFLWRVYGFTPFFFAGCYFFSALLAVTVTDWETGLVPDKITLPSMVVGLIFCTVWPQLQEQTVFWKGFLFSLAGLLAGGGILLSTGLLGNFIFKKDSMGGGDIKLLAFVGAFIGPVHALIVFLVAPIISLPLALYTKLVLRKDMIAYGPYLAIAAGIFYVYGNKILAWFF